MLDWLVPYVDYLFLVGAVALDISFVPTIIRRRTPDLWTSVTFTAVLAAFTLGFLALDLYWSALAQGIGAVLWGITIFQRGT